MENNIIAKQAEQKAEQKKQPSRKDILQAWIVKQQDEIRKALPSVITPERFTRMVYSAISTNPLLAECTVESFLGAMMTAAQLGLEPNTPLGQAYLIPRKNHGVLKCQFELGYKGLIDLAYRSGEVSIVQAHEVRENDTFEYSLGLDPKLVHVPAATNRGKTIYYYAIFKTKDGGYGFDVASKDDMVEFANRYSEAYKQGKSTPWNDNFDAMAKKTVLKATLKYAPLRSDFARALSNDETIKSAIDVDMSDVPSDIVYTVDEETGEVKEEATNDEA